MDDIQFALAASPDIGGLYQSAKFFSADAPGQALLFLRGVAAKYCLALDRDFTERDSIEDRIRSLERRGLLRQQTLRNLRTLQRNGNRSAHPEQYAHESHDYRSMAVASLEAARELLEQLFVMRGEPVPAYEVTELEQSGLRDMCYLAMMKSDVEAMHQAGVIFKEKADQVEHLDNILQPDGYGENARPHIDQAMFWFKKGAAQKHPDCMYRFGLYQAETRHADSWTIRQGEDLIRQAAENDHADALVYVAGGLLDGKGIFEQDADQAREYYEKAAAQGHPAALGQLGAIYEQGIGCDPDPAAAARYTIRAAEAGFPQGQFNLFVLYIHGTGVEQDSEKAIHWLQLAFEQDFPPAIYNRACLTQQGMIEGETLRDALPIYRRCFGIPEYRARAALAIAEITLAVESTPESWVDSAMHLQECYEAIVRDGDPHELMGDCLAASKKAVARLRDHLGRNGPDPKQKLNDVFCCFLFDGSGVPVADKKARVEQFFGLMEGANSNRVGAKDRVIDQLMKEAFIAQMHPPVIPPPDRRLQATANAQAPARQGRNELCHCGSGKKFKKCHGS